MNLRFWMVAIGIAPSFAEPTISFSPKGLGRPRDLRHHSGRSRETLLALDGL
jgi:hypothetical protein